jgi:Arc/MetJ family transcription regulator
MCRESWRQRNSVRMISFQENPLPDCISAESRNKGRALKSGVMSIVLPYSRICDMAFRMKTTLNIDDTVMAELKREAARQGRTMSEMVETALRLLLRSQRKRNTIPALPKFRSGGTLVDIADRDALYQAMEGR